MTPWLITPSTLLAHRRRPLLAATLGAALLASACVAAPTDEAPPAAAADDQPTPQALLVAPAGATPEGEAALAFGAAEAPPPVHAASAGAQPPALVQQQIATEAVAQSLAITSPTHGAGLDDSYVLFSGAVEPGSTVSSGPFAADVTAEGSWTLGLVLQPGANVATFTAADAAGRTSTRTVTVYHTGVQKTHAAAHDAFSAHQQYGSCGEDPPYDIFSGSSLPGALVHVSSAYGSGSTVADKNGDWKLRVEFPAAPAGVVFDVVASDGVGSRNMSFYREQRSAAH
jgi:hypothetical protein